MCGRFSFAYEDDWSEVLRYFGLNQSSLEYPRRYNIAPGQEIPAIVSDGNERRIAAFRWGLIPHWSKDGKSAYKMINARAETLLEKPAFKGLVRRNRCIIPADGFYEWKAEYGRKQPYRIVLRDRKLFGFAGLYDTWRSPNGTKMATCTIITCAPNELMAEIHNRMPVILPREHEELWLDPAAEPELAMTVLQPYPAEDMEAYPVSPAVGNVRNEGPGLIHPL